jgi:hypothetical protein
VFNQEVHVEVIDVDRYHREVGRIYLGERFINLEMMQDGFAWRYPQYDKPISGESSPRRKPTPASTDADCGLIRIRRRRGSGGAKSAVRRTPVKRRPLRPSAAIVFRHPSPNTDRSVLLR